MKRVGSCFYVHMSCVGDLKPLIPADRYKSILRDSRLPIFSYDYVKYDKKTSVYTLVNCFDWELSSEPELKDSVTVYPNEERVYREYFENPPIIHGKHLFYGKDQEAEEWWKKAKARWDSYQGQPWLDKKRMGRLKWWRENALPILLHL